MRCWGESSNRVTASVIAGASSSFTTMPAEPMISGSAPESVPMTGTP
jgi:hypothetical protein